MRTVEEARAALEQFKKRTRVTSLGEETSLRLKALSNLQEELSKTETDLLGMQQKRDELRSRLAEQEQFVKYQSNITDNPVVLQAVYNHSYLNTVALRAASIDGNTADPRGGKIEKDASGNPTGIVRGAGGVAFVAAKIPLKDQEAWLANTRRLVSYLNALGITAWSDAGGRGIRDLRQQLLWFLCGMVRVLRHRPERNC